MGPYFTDYLEILENAALTASLSTEVSTQNHEWHYGQARKHLENELLKTTGVFFTNEEISTALASMAESSFLTGAVILDPACGAGDLLLACAKRLAVGKSLGETLEIWGEKLAGSDINAGFVRAAKARLVLLARELTGDASRLNVSFEDLFPKILVADGLIAALPASEKLVLIMNPPYNQMPSPTRCTWAEGSITSAAGFLYRYIRDCQDGTRFYAILPEVLRSGSRYRKWRSSIATNTCDLRKQVLGRFSRIANVDVFILDGTIMRGQGNCEDIRWWDAEMSFVPGKKIADLFHVNVGTVVPHRDAEIGNRHPYIYTRVVKPWDNLIEPSSFRNHDGKIFYPPFVVVRRTSAPKDKPRCAASIINFSQKVAVENHFIVLTPKNGDYMLCEMCLRKLRDNRTTEWINKRIKCRHLTVSSISEIPWWEEE